MMRPWCAIFLPEDEEVSVLPKGAKIKSYTERISGVSVDCECFTSSQFACFRECAMILAVWAER